MSSINGIIVPNSFPIKINASSLPPDVLTEDNVRIVTNKNLTDNSNTIFSEALWTDGKNAIVDISMNGPPTNGQALIAGGPTEATWADVVTPQGAATLENKTLIDVTGSDVAVNKLFYSNDIGDPPMNLVNGPAAPPNVGTVLTTAVGGPTPRAEWIEPVYVNPSGIDDTFEISGTTITTLIPQPIGSFVLPFPATDQALVVTVRSTGKSTANQPLAFVTTTSFLFETSGVLTKYGEIIDNYSGILISANPRVVTAGAATLEVTAADNGLPDIRWECTISISSQSA